MKNYKFSIITPTHKYNENLIELYRSIKNQTYTNWEWVLLLNSEFRKDLVPPEINNDHRVKIYSDYSSHGFYSRGDNHQGGMIGYYKNKAFNLGTGDILVEVDHDDLLLPNCIEELHIAYQDTEVGFVSSEAAYWDKTGSEKHSFNVSCGWESYIKYIDGKKCIVNKGFEISSRSIGFIWYCPDHVRSWRKTVYDEIGGHNIHLPFCDDHELMIRTYLNSKMKFIEKVLYIYRITDYQATDETRDAIQIKTRELFEQYAVALAEREADLRNLLKVDLGGGPKGIWSKEGYLNLDMCDDSDVKCDLNDGIPLDDNSVGVLNASHILEHLKDPFKSMSEIHRVLADDGWAFIEVPSTDGRGAFQDPTHISFWNENCFWYYTKKQQAQYISNDTIRFQSHLLDTIYPSEFDKQHNIYITRAWLTALKSNKRRGGVIEI